MRYFVSLTLLLAAIGCSPKYLVKVDSINDSRSYGQKYVLFPGDDKADELLFGEFARYVEAALAKHNYVRVDNPKDANLAIVLMYGISGPQTEIATAIVPVTERKQGSTYNVNSTTHGNYGQSYRTQGTVKENDKYETSYQSNTYTYTTHTRVVVLTAYSTEAVSRNPKTQPKAVWQTKLASTGSSSDLRSVFPIMIAAGANQFGMNTKGQIEVELSDSDKRIQEIKSYDNQRAIASEPRGP